MGLGKMLNYLNTQSAGWLTAPQGLTAEYRVTGEILPRLLVADAKTSSLSAAGRENWRYVWHQQYQQ